MKNHKRVLTFLMIALIVLFYAPNRTYADTSGESSAEAEEILYQNLFYYKLIDNELHITRAYDDQHFKEDGSLDYTDRCLITSLYIPETLPIDGTEYPVTYIDGSIGSTTGAFKGCFNLTSLTLPSSLKSIGDAAFQGCENLTSVQLPEGLEYLGSSAFGDCTSLQSINIPKGVQTHQYAGEQAYRGPLANTPVLSSVDLEDGRTTIGNGFFEYSGITEIMIPSSVTEINKYAFYDTENLTTVTFAEDSTLQKIGWKAFSESGLTAFYMPETVNYVDVGAFAGCTQLQTVRLSANMTCNANQTERGYDTGVFSGCTALTDVIFPEGMTKIGRCWFFDSPITSITIPASVTEIEEAAFRYCLSLSEVVLEDGSSLEKIGKTAFIKDGALTSFNFPETLKILGNNAFESTGLTEVILPDSLETMYAGVFNSCSSLTSVTIPAGMTYEWGNNNGAFEGSNSLKTVIFKPGVDSIDAGLFGWNEGIESIEIPEGVTSIGARAFRRAYNLKSVTFPASLSSIASEAFSDCTGLETMTFQGSRPTVSSSICAGVEATVYFGTWDEEPDNWGGTLTFVGDITAPEELQIIDYEKDTWNFRNYEESIPYEDYAKFFTPVVSKLLSAKLPFIKGDPARCYGMSILIPSIMDYGFPENLTGNDIHSLEKTAEVRKWLRYAHISQFLPDLTEEEAENTNDYNGLYRAIKNSLGGTGNKVIIAIDGHEVLPVSILKDTEDDVWIGIYDSNYPNNYDSDAGEPAYAKLVLSGENGDYTECHYYRSLEKGADKADKEQTFKTVSYVTSIQSFINAYNSKKKIDYNAWMRGNVNSKICRLVYFLNDNRDALIAGVNTVYPINIKDGEGDTENGALYWIKDDDDQMTISGVEPGNEIILASDTNSISIKATGTADVSFQINENQSHAELAMDTPGSVVITCVSGEDNATEVTAEISVDDHSSFSFEDGLVSATGISAIDVTAVSGVIDESGKVQGEVEEYSADNVDPSAQYTVAVNKQLSTPEVSSVTNVVGGVKITWEAVPGAEKYRLFRKTYNVSTKKWSKWANLADTTSVQYTDKTAVTGTKYKYTVRCISADGKTYTSSFDSAGKNITYVAAPTISSLKNVNGGVKVVWPKTKGASKYRVFRKTGSGKWTKLTDTTSTTYTDKKASNGKTYAYTIRCLNSSGKYASAYNTTGKSITYVQRPAISSLTSPKTKQILVKWSKNKKATGYQIQYSTSSTFAKGNKTVTVKGASKVSKTISKLKSKKKYYVRIRTYKTVNGKKYYSAWSAKKKVTTK